jgi:hypothetical protein
VLRNHPQVDLWKYKETYYFNKRYVNQPIEWYQYQFRNGNVTGEITPTYFGHTNKGVHIRMAEAVPDAKLLLLLRDPVQAIISTYWLRRHWKKADVMSVTVDQLLYEVARDQRPEWKYGRDYAARLEEWLEVYSMSQFWIAKSEDIWNQPALAADMLWKFLGVKCMPVKKWPVMKHSHREQKASRAAMEELREAFIPMEDRLTELLGPQFSWRGAS